MLIAAIVTAVVAVLLAGLGAVALIHAPHGSPQRMMAPAQLTAAAMLAAGVASAIFAPTGIGVMALVVCYLAAGATIGAVAWQIARATAVAEQLVSTGGCGNTCGGCPSAGAVCERP